MYTTKTTTTVPQGLTQPSMSSAKRLVAEDNSNIYPKIVENDGEERLMSSLNDQGIFSRNPNIVIDMEETGAVYVTVEMHYDSKIISKNIAGIKSKLRDCSLQMSNEVSLPVLDVVSIKIQQNNWDGNITAKLSVDGKALL